jgi:hypothetical protein
MHSDELSTSNSFANIATFPPLEISGDAQEVIAEMKIGDRIPQIYDLLCDEFGDIGSAALLSVPDYEGEGGAPDLMFELRTTLSHSESSKRMDAFFMKLRERFGFDIYRIITVWPRSHESA